MHKKSLIMVIIIFWSIIIIPLLIINYSQFSDFFMKKINRLERNLLNFDNLERGDIIVYKQNEDRILTDILNGKKGATLMIFVFHLMKRFGSIKA